MSRVLTERQISDLLDCLFDEFELKHGADTSRLRKSPFFLTNRMSCAKSARLNFMDVARDSDGQTVQMHQSLYTRAVETLVQRGLAEQGERPLEFTLSLKGYEHVRNKRLSPKKSLWATFQEKLNSHNGLIAVIGIIVAVLLACWFAPTNSP